MNQRSIGFIGGGRVTRILLEGWRRAQVWPARLVASDRQAEVLQRLEAYAVLSAMGPTYLWFQLQALREVATGFGLSEAELAPALKRMMCGSTRTLLESGLTPAEVMDLIPVKPLAEMEASVGELYRTRLPALYQKLKP